MIVYQIKDATRVLGAPSDWDGKEIPCNALPILDVTIPEGQFMVSEWMPSREEIARLVLGEPVKLWVRGTEHPVVALAVDEPSKNGVIDAYDGAREELLWHRRQLAAIHSAVSEGGWPATMAETLRDLSRAYTS
jgi:hypothetical protein